MHNKIWKLAYVFSHEFSRSVHLYEEIASRNEPSEKIEKTVLSAHEKQNECPIPPARLQHFIIHGTLGTLFRRVLTWYWRITGPN